MTTGLTYRQTTVQNPTADSKKVYQESNERQEVSYKKFFPPLCGYFRRCGNLPISVSLRLRSNASPPYYRMPPGRRR
jgi:hypothetical protein